VGRDGQGQQDFGSWTDIVQVAAGEVYTVGLKPDGTVVITGSCGCDVSGWDLIV
jgi:alpha-tubulin suppressor-like RCC1 family protein